jgi:hypothetical protein
MGVSDETKNVIPLKFLRKIENIFFFQWLKLFVPFSRKISKLYGVINFLMFYLDNKIDFLSIKFF